METKIVTPIIIALAICTFSGYMTSIWSEFWIGFSIALVVQFIIGMILNNHYRFVAAIEMEQQLTQRIADSARQTLKLKCPCTKNIEQMVPINLNDINVYKCLNCDKGINVDISAKTALITEIVDINATHDQVINAMSNIASISNAAQQ